MSNQNNIKVNLHPITKGYGTIIEHNYRYDLETAVLGGHQTQKFFDLFQPPHEFWLWLADQACAGLNPFGPGKDPQGNPIVVTTNFRTDIRIAAFYVDETIPSPSREPILGVVHVDIGSRRNFVVRTMAFAITCPSIAKPDRSLFMELLPSLYENISTVICRLAGEIAASPTSPEQATTRLLRGLQDGTWQRDPSAAPVNLVVDATNVAYGFTGFAASAAARLWTPPPDCAVHHRLEIHNLTNLDFTWSIPGQIHGTPVVIPATSHLAQQASYENLWGDGELWDVAHSAAMQWYSTPETDSVGYVLDLTPTNQRFHAKIVANLPHNGAAGLWVGQSDDDASYIFAQHNAPDASLTTTAVFDKYKITQAVNRRTIETNSTTALWESVIVIEV